MAGFKTTKIRGEGGTWKTYHYTPSKARAKAGEPSSWGYRLPGGGAQYGFATEAQAAAAMRKHSDSLASIRANVTAPRAVLGRVV